MTTIPKGNSTKDKKIRRELIYDNLKGLIGKEVYCPALGKNVEFVSNSIRETATHASKTYKSTLASFRVLEAIGRAEYISTDIPKEGKQTSLRFVKIHELSASLTKIGTVKIIVGERKNKRVLHYCITAERKTAGKQRSS